jgi:hypothetical protein
MASLEVWEVERHLRADATGHFRDSSLSPQLTAVLFRFVREATIEVAGKRETLSTHEGAEVPAGVPHQIFNESKHDVEFLVISQPPSHGDRVRYC